MANIGSKGRFHEFTDFTEDTLNADLFKTTADASGTVAIQADAIGGVVDLTTDANNNDMNEISRSQPVRASDGPCWFEAKLQVNGIATVAFSVGFNDDPDEASNTLPAELSGTTFTSNASDFAGVIFDTAADTDNFYFFAVSSDADTSETLANLNTGLAPTAAQDFIVRVELYDRGSADGKADAVITIVKHNGTFKQKRIERAVGRSVKLYPHVAIENRTTAARVLSLDYIDYSGSRA